MPDNARRYLQEIFDSTLNGILALKVLRDSRGAVIDFEWGMINARAEVMVGCTRDKLIGSRLLTRSTSRLTIMLFELGIQVVTNGLPGERVYTIEEDGVRKSYHLTANKLSDGVVISLTDIPNQQIEKAMRESEARWQALMAANPDFIFRMARDGTYLDYYAANPEELYIPPAEFLGRKVSEVLPQLGELTIAHIEKALQTNEIVTFEYHREKDGGRLYAEVRIIASGPDEVICIVRDITDRKQAQEQMLALALEKERVRLLTSFIRDVSHEFKIPLSIMNTKLYLMNRSDNPEARQQKAASIAEQIARISTLVDMLVKMSWLDSGIPFTFNRVKLNSLIQRMINAMRLAFADKQLLVELQLAPDLPVIEGDEEQLMEVLQQLIDNAVRFTSPGDRITISTARHDADMVMIDVRDTGDGVPEQALSKIFGRFFRLDTAHSTPGFGLGLPIALSIVERHGGKIMAESHVNEGSTFQILLPIAQKLEENG